MEWITHNFYIPETGKPITLVPYQTACLNEALSRVNGMYKYSTIVWSDIKKSAKSTLAAAVATYVCFNKPRAKIRFVGNDLRQADSRVFNAVADAVDLNPNWRNNVNVRQHTVQFPNGSIIESIPVDPQGEAGGNDDMVSFTELWASNGDAHKKLWTELALSPTKFGQSFRWIDTYAGYIGESELLENLYKHGTEEGVKLDLSYADHDLSDLNVYANPSARLFLLWNGTPRCPWQSEEYYQSQAADLLETEFLRMHRNQWVINASDPLVPWEWWEACRGEIPLLGKHESLFLAMDAGVASDCFAIVGVSRYGVRAVVRYVRAWVPPKGGKLKFSNEADPNDPNYPEGEIRRLVKAYNVAEIAYDPYQLHDMANRLSGLANFIEVSQGGKRLVADKQLRDAIRDKRILHSGEPELTQHIRNANVKSEGEVDKLRIVKRSAHLKVDLAVALSMANYRAMDGVSLAEGWLKSTKVATAPKKQTLEELAQGDLAKLLGIPALGQPLKNPTGRKWGVFGH